MRWGYLTNRFYNTKEAYKLTFNQGETLHSDAWNNIWNFYPWPKIATIIWLVAHKRILTGENLMKRGMHGLFWCALCEHKEENMDHHQDS